MTIAAPSSPAPRLTLPDVDTLRLDFLEYWTHALPHTAAGREVPMFFWGAQVRHHAAVVEHSLAYTPPDHYLVPHTIV